MRTELTIMKTESEEYILIINKHFNILFSTWTLDKLFNNLYLYCNGVMTAFIQDSKEVENFIKLMYDYRE
jgi:hypothetical protein